MRIGQCHGKHESCLGRALVRGKQMGGGDMEIELPFFGIGRSGPDLRGDDGCLTTDSTRISGIGIVIERMVDEVFPDWQFSYYRYPMGGQFPPGANTGAQQN